MFVKQDRKERKRLRKVRTILLKGGIPFSLVVDIGANIGTTSLAAVEFGADRVIALEPELRNFRLLRANVALNGLEERVTTFNVAIGATRGTATLHVSPRNSGDHRVVKTESCSGAGVAMDTP